ncbi:hypothetical protein O4H54_24075, partial [Rhodococcus yunnanensis]
ALSSFTALIRRTAASPLLTTAIRLNNVSLFVSYVSVSPDRVRPARRGSYQIFGPLVAEFGR